MRATGRRRMGFSGGHGAPALVNTPPGRTQACGGRWRAMVYTLAHSVTDRCMSEHTPVRRPRHRGIYLLPNLFTTAAMFAGYYAIVASIGGRFTEAAIAVFVAALLDGMDGRVARLTGTQ